ncbi:MAG: alpha/beta hydrolase [Parasporobacterium sp.]|nr:alpha/beta hydrolase [Parasporobacterium sp.]
MAEGIKDFDAAADLDKIQCPVLVIGDMEDHVLGPAAVENIGQLLQQKSDCELYMYDGYGHAVYDTAPDFKERVFHFFYPEEPESLMNDDSIAEKEKDIQYVMYLGTNDKDTNEPVFSQEEAKQQAKEILIRYFGGYTIQPA